MKQLMSGNEAIAQGAYEANVKVAVGYPGTPSSEILECICQYDGIKAQWAPNEKVALEVAAGASLGGARTLVTMKHVGLNVAADPLLTLSYTGVRGGLVILCADDPGMHSSQNEQDTRMYALFAQVPLLEPGDSEEARRFTKLAFEISEEYDTPVILRSTTRISHSKSLVNPEARKAVAKKEYQKNMSKFVMLPVNAKKQHTEVLGRMSKLTDYASESTLNTVEWGSLDVGIITNGIAYQYVKEAAPDLSVLKLGMVHPIPQKLTEEFASRVKQLVIVEELEPFIENQVKILGIPCVGKDIFPREGELSTALVKQGLSQLGIIEYEVLAEPLQELPKRPPALCPSCPHRGIFYTLSRMKIRVTGDIGCYTLGALPPLSSMDSCLCMGASVGMAHGWELANEESATNTVGVIGDSTFLHSGVTGLMNTVYNKGTSTIIILDNSTTAMTGMQEHPGTGKTLGGEETHAVGLHKLVESLGVKRIVTVDPYDLEAVEKVVKEELSVREPSVIITTRPCALKAKFRQPALKVDAAKCMGCQACLRLGCPALSFSDNLAKVDPVLCTGCGLCAQVCKFDAIGQ